MQRIKQRKRGHPNKIEKANTLKPVSTSASRRSTKKTIVGRERKRKQADKENSKPEQNVTAQQAISLEKLPIKKRTLRSLQNSISSENSSAIRLSNESEAIVPAGTTRYGFYRAAQDHLKKNPWLINGCSECKARIDKQPGTITLHFYSHIGMKVACCVPGCTEKRSNPDTMCRHWQNHGCSNDEETLTKFYREFERFCGAQPHSLYAQTEKEKLLLKENNS